MSDPQRLTTLWAFTACYRDSFTLHAYSRRKAVKWRFCRYSRELIATDATTMLQFIICIIEEQCRREQGTLQTCHVCLIYCPMFSTPNIYTGFSENYLATSALPVGRHTLVYTYCLYTFYVIFGLHVH
jgi:hypothetical protein